MSDPDAPNDWRAPPRPELQVIALFLIQTLSHSLS